GVEDEPGLTTMLAHQVERPVDMLARLGMKGDPGRTGLREIGYQTIDWLDHQMHVDRCRDPVVAQRLAHEGPDREIRHVMVVHHVEMDGVRARSDHSFDFLTKPCKVGREDGSANP